MTSTQGYAGGGPAPSAGGKGPPCGLAVAAPLLCLQPRAKPQGHPIAMHQLLQGSQQLWALITTCYLGTLR